MGFGGKLGCPLLGPGGVTEAVLLVTVDKTGVEVVVGGSIEPLPLWFEKTGATLLIGLPALFANLKRAIHIGNNNKKNQ